MLYPSPKRIQISEMPRGLRLCRREVGGTPEAREDPQHPPSHRAPDRVQAIGLRRPLGVPSLQAKGADRPPLPPPPSQRIVSTAQLRNDYEYSSPGCARVTCLSAYAKSELTWAGGKEDSPKENI